MTPIKLKSLPPKIQAQIRRLTANTPSKSTPAPPPTPKKRKTGPNLTEVLFALNMLKNQDAFYEALTFRLPGGSRYTPDWCVWQPDGKLICYEVKGPHRLFSHGRAYTAFRETRARFTKVEFHWFIKTETGEFLEKYIQNPTPSHETLTTNR
jgi:hypothetical protein